MNVESERAPHIRQASEGRGSRGARFFIEGSTSESIARRLQKLSGVLSFAQKHGLGVSWD